MEVVSYYTSIYSFKLHKKDSVLELPIGQVRKAHFIKILTFSIVTFFSTPFIVACSIGGDLE